MARFHCFATCLSLALFSSSAVCLLVSWALPDAWEPCLLCCCCFSVWFIFGWRLYVAAAELTFLYSVRSTSPNFTSSLLKSCTAGRTTYGLCSASICNVENYKPSQKHLCNHGLRQLQSHLKNIFRINWLWFGKTYPCIYLQQTRLL